MEQHGALRARLMRVAYSALMVALQPMMLARLLWRARAEPGYAHGLPARLGWYRGEAAPVHLWVHAVSLGETLAAKPLVAALRARHPGLSLLLTHGTATGHEAGAALLQAGDVQTWLPFDSPGAVRRFVRHYRPTVGVLMETEIWPNLLAAAHAEGVPMVLANARLSERSARAGRWLDALRRPALAQLRAVLAQTPTDAERLQACGARNVQVLGNLKFDLQPDTALLARGKTWRAASGRAVVLMAVSREGEEAALLDAWVAEQQPFAARPSAQRPVLLIVPRHPQRFDEVAGLVVSKGLKHSRRSTWGDALSAQAQTADVWLGDTLREMPMYYGLADVALLGGSFAPLGGQNLIEAAACGCPLIIGPHTFNFADAAERALAAGAAVRVGAIREALALATEWLDDAAALAARGQAATAFAAKHRGAAERMAAAIKAFL